jgi:hypothetical protein
VVQGEFKEIQSRLGPGYEPLYTAVVCLPDTYPGLPHSISLRKGDFLCVIDNDYKKQGYWIRAVVEDTQQHVVMPKANVLRVVENH